MNSTNETSISSSSFISEEVAESGGGALYYFLAILSPICFSLTNLVDKTAVSGRIKHTPSYLMMIGVFDCVAALIIAACCDWSSEALEGKRVIDFFFPVFAAIFWAGTIYFYFGGILLADASIVIGVENVYPLIVVILSAIFLSERIASVGYIGCVFLVIGAVALSLNVVGMIRAKCKKPGDNEAVKEVDEEAGCAPGVECWFPCGTWCSNCLKMTKYKLDTMGQVGNEKPAAVVVDDGEEKKTYNRVDSTKSLVSDRSVSPAVSPSVSPAAVMTEKKEEGKKHRHHHHRSSSSHHHKKEESKRKSESDDEADEKLDNAIEELETIVPIGEEDHEKEILPEKKEEEQNWVTNIFAFCQRHRNSKGLLLAFLIPMAISAALFSFMAKVSTNGLGPFNVCAIQFFSFGLFMLASGLITPLKGARYFVSEFKRNWLFCLLSDAFTIAGQILLIVALSGMPASIVTCLTGVQPFCVLLLERVFGIASDTVKDCFTDKLVPVIFIVAGVIILSLLSV